MHMQGGHAEKKAKKKAEEAKRKYPSIAGVVSVCFLPPQLKHGLHFPPLVKVLHLLGVCWSWSGIVISCCLLKNVHAESDAIGRFAIQQGFWSISGSLFLLGFQMVLVT